MSNNGGKAILLTTEGTFQGTNGLELFYRVLKPETAPKAAVIAVHGLGDHSGGMHTMTQRLAEQGYAVYAFDLRGHGRSPGKRGFIRRWEEYTGDLHAFRQMVEQEQPNAPLYIIGHSLGGVISIDYALSQPDGLAGLVALAPAISYEMSRSEKLLITLLGFVKPDLHSKGKANYDYLTKDLEVKKRLMSDDLRHNMKTPGLGRGLMQAVSRVQTNVHKIQLPFLLQFGLDDHVTPHGKLQQFFDSVTFTDKQKIEYEGMRHRPYDDLERETFLADLIDWLDRKTEKGS